MTEETTAEPAADEESPNPNAENLIKKKDMYDHVTVATGLRKREVREAIDATLAYMFDCLTEGKSIQCAPLGKIRVITKGEGENAKVMYRLNLQKPGKGKLAREAAAEKAAEEDSV